MNNKQLFDELEIQCINNCDHIWAIDRIGNRKWPLEIDTLRSFSDDEYYQFSILAKQGGDFYYRNKFESEVEAKKYMDYVSELIEELNAIVLGKQLNFS